MSARAKVKFYNNKNNTHSSILLTTFKCTINYCVLTKFSQKKCYSLIPGKTNCQQRFMLFKISLRIFINYFHNNNRFNNDENKLFLLYRMNSQVADAIKTHMQFSISQKSILFEQNMFHFDHRLCVLNNGSSRHSSSSISAIIM